MRLTAMVTTEDGRLTAGKVYEGQFVLAPGCGEAKADGSEWKNSFRFLCWDDKGTWTTFNIHVFMPVGEFSARTYGR